MSDTDANSESDETSGSVMDVDEAETSAPREPELRQLGGRLEGLSLPRQVMVLAIWPFMEQLLGFLVGTADLAIAARLTGPKEALAATDALAIAGYIGWLIGLMLGAVGTGATALIARAVGARHRTLANAGLGQAILLALFMGFIGMFVLLVFGGLLARVFLPINPQDPALGALSRELCTQYLRIFALAVPAAGILFVGNASLRGAGEMRSPFWAMVVVNLVNVVTSVWLALGEIPWVTESLGLRGLDLGVRGIALGTLIAWYTGALIVLGVLVSGRAPIRLRRHRLIPHPHTMRRITRVGLPALGEQMGMWMINAAVVFYVTNLAAIGAVGAHMIAIRIEAVSFLPGFAIGIAASTLVGQYLGLGDPQRAQRSAELCVLLGIVVMSAMGMIFMLFPNELVYLVSPNSPEHQGLAPTLLVICGVIQPFFAMYAIFGHALRGAGDTRWTMRLSYASMFILRLIGAGVMSQWLGYGLAGIWIALCADLMVKGLLFAGRFYHGGWKRIEV